VVFLIGAVGVEFFHRQILPVALVPLGTELALSDTQSGMLISAFALAYAVAAFAVGRAADRGNRRNVYALGIAVWSVATAAGAACGGFLSFFATRLLVGVGQAASGACNGPLIADYVRPERRSGAMGLVAVAAAIGVVAALVAGGFATERFGWRAAFAGAGIAGLVFALAFVWVVQEPARGWSEGRSHEPGDRPALGEVLRTLGSIPALRHVLFGAVLANTALLAGAQWGPAFFMRVHHLGLADAGAAGGAAALLAVGGGVAGGVIADRAWARDRKAVLRIPAACFALAFPLSYAAFLWPGTLGSLALLITSVGLAMVHNAPVGAAVQALAPLRTRALASGLFNAVLTLVSLGGGPLLTGWISDRFGDGTEGSGLARALAGSSLLYLGAALHFFLAARSFASDLERSRAYQEG
jgi:MFS family permease